MSKGFLSGLAWGAVAFTLVFGLIALLGPRPDVPAPSLPQRADAPGVTLPDELSGTSRPERSAVSEVATDTDTDAAPQDPVNLTETAGTTPDIAEADVASSSEPAASEIAEQGDDMPDTPNTPDAPAPEAPMLSLGDATRAPGGASAPTIGAAPDGAPNTPLALPRSITLPDVPTPSVPEIDTAAPAAPPPAAPEAEPAGTDIDAEVAEDTGTADTTPPQDSAAAPARDTAPPDVAGGDGTDVLAALPDDGGAPTPRGSIPQPGLTPFEGVRTNRLPTVTGSPADAPDDAADQNSTDAEPADSDMYDMSLPAYLRYALPFENPRVLPLMAIVLVDDGVPSPTRDLIKDLPFPLTVAVDPTLFDATGIAAAYRAAGKEVVALATALPARAAASDIDVTFASHFDALPHAVAVLDVSGGGFQGNRALSQLVVPVLATDGHGLITYDRGLNAAAQVAQAAGVAQTQVFRDLDDDAPNAFVLRRYLDRAAFEAVRDGQVVVTGRASHAPTLEAILSWRMEGRASDVALVPVSATLRSE